MGGEPVWLARGGMEILRITYLEGGQTLRPLVHVHMPHADADGAGRDDDDSVAIFTELDSRLNDDGEDGQVRLTRLFIHNGTRSWTTVLAWWGDDRDKRGWPKS